MKTDSSKLSAADKRRSAIDALLDHALEETFPASDSMAVTVEVATVSGDSDKPSAKPKTGQS
jgi:hypothetical protein